MLYMDYWYFEVFKKDGGLNKDLVYDEKDFKFKSVKNGDNMLFLPSPSQLYCCSILDQPTAFTVVFRTS